MLLVTGLAARETLATAVLICNACCPTLRFLSWQWKIICWALRLLLPGYWPAQIFWRHCAGPCRWDILVVPETAVRAGCFIDDCTTADLARELDKPVCAAADFLDLTEILIREVK